MAVGGSKMINKQQKMWHKLDDAIYCKILHSNDGTFECSWRLRNAFVIPNPRQLISAKYET